MQVEIRKPKWSGAAIFAARLWKAFSGYTGNRLARLRDFIISQSTVFVDGKRICQVQEWQWAGAISSGLKCLDCGEKAVTFHGVTTITHGYCERHRCCAKCGGRVNGGEVNPCRCRRGPTERDEYRLWKEYGPWVSRDDKRAASLKTDAGMQELDAALADESNTEAAP
jgi:hypothetical protein